jgi:hypothetical protein
VGHTRSFFGHLAPFVKIGDRAVRGGADRMPNGVDHGRSAENLEQAGLLVSAGVADTACDRLISSLAARFEDDVTVVLARIPTGSGTAVYRPAAPLLEPNITP